jgi:hypothetical protein
MEKIDGEPYDPLASKLNKNFAETVAADTANSGATALAQADATLALGAGIPFMVTNKLVSTAAGTAVHVLPDASVPAGKKVYVTGTRWNVSGSTAWTDVTATEVYLQDTATSPSRGMTVSKTALLGNAVIDSLAISGVTAATFILLNAGFTASKGLDVVADANFTAGSDLYVTVWGYIK